MKFLTDKKRMYMKGGKEKDNEVKWLHYITSLVLLSLIASGKTRQNISGTRLTTVSKFISYYEHCNL